MVHDADYQVCPVVHDERVSVLATLMDVLKSLTDSRIHNSNPSELSVVSERRFGGLCSVVGIIEARTELCLIWKILNIR